MYVNYSLTVHNSSGRRDIVANVVFLIVSDDQRQQLVLKREARLQRFADI